MFRTLLITCLATSALVLAGPTPDAHAGNTSAFTLGVGAGAGVRSTGYTWGSKTTSHEFVNHASVRAKILWLLGADFSIDLSADSEVPAGNALNLGSRVRATALFYALPTPIVSVYFGTGVGAPKISELTDITSTSSSYHVGGGIEFHLTDRLTIDLSYYMILPSVGGVTRHVEQQALTYLDDYVDGHTNPGGVTNPGPAELPLPDATVGDFINPRNFELVVRVFIFL